MADHRDWLDLVLDEDWQPSRDEALTTLQVLTRISPTAPRRRDG